MWKFHEPYFNRSIKFPQNYVIEMLMQFARLIYANKIGQAAKWTVWNAFVIWIFICFVCDKLDKQLEIVGTNWKKTSTHRLPIASVLCVGKYSGCCANKKKSIGKNATTNATQPMEKHVWNARTRIVGAAHNHQTTYKTLILIRTVSLLSL